jgi:hypothetical protein
MSIFLYVHEILNIEPFFVCVYMYITVTKTKQPDETMTISITVKVRLSLWSAIKLRIAGVYSKPHDDLDGKDGISEEE